MKLKIFQIDAFTATVFKGNPAAVVPLSSWIDDGLMQKIAAENNLAETAFYVPFGERFEIRWFTPTIEVDLCGHATLAAASVLFDHEGYESDKVIFNSRSGELSVTNSNKLLTLDFPADPVTKTDLTEEIYKCFSRKPLVAYKGKSDLMLVFESESDIVDLNPDFRKLAQLPYRGVCATARGDEVDFVSRFFAPQSGIDEDPVTGSAHTTLVPYWSGVLKKQELTAHQVSPRSGILYCKNSGDRVNISGHATTYLVGEIQV